LKVLRQGDEPRAAGGGLIGQPYRGVDVGLRIGSGIELDEGDAQLGHDDARL
jgi:hypothetical protein